MYVYTTNIIEKYLGRNVYFQYLHGWSGCTVDLINDQAIWTLVFLRDGLHLSCSLQFILEGWKIISIALTTKYYNIKDLI